MVHVKLNPSELFIKLATFYSGKLQEEVERYGRGVERYNHLMVYSPVRFYLPRVVLMSDYGVVYDTGAKISPHDPSFVINFDQLLGVDHLKQQYQKIVVNELFKFMQK